MNMTNLWPAINTLRMEATRLRQTSKRAEAAEDMDTAADVLEAAGKIPRHLLQRAIGHMPDDFLAVAEWKLANDLSAALPDKPEKEK